MGYFFFLAIRMGYYLLCLFPEKIGKIYLKSWIFFSDCWFLNYFAKHKVTEFNISVFFSFTLLLANQNESNVFHFLSPFLQVDSDLFSGFVIFRLS